MKVCVNRALLFCLVVLSLHAFPYPFPVCIVAIWFFAASFNVRPFAEAKREGKTTAMVTVEENVVERSSHEFFVKSIYGFSKVCFALFNAASSVSKHVSSPYPPASCLLTSCFFVFFAWWRQTMTDLAKGKMKNVRHSHIGGGGGK